MKKTIDELKTTYYTAKSKYVGKKYLHIKSNKLYYIEGVSIDCDTNEVLLQYSPIENFSTSLPLLFSRPLSSFIEIMENGQQRFEEVIKVDFYLTSSQKKEIVEKYFNKE